MYVRVREALPSETNGKIISEINVSGELILVAMWC